MEDMKKKKKPKKLAPLWVPVPEARQMYPHVHYDKELNLNWIFQVMGILRSWDMTLTHLIAKLADLHNADIEKIVSELQELLDKIQSWINALTSALNSYANAEALYQQQAIAEAQSLVLLTQTIQTAINEIYPILTEVLQCIEDTLDTYESYFEEIFENINDIYNDITTITNNITNINADLSGINKRLDEIDEYIDELFDALNTLISNSVNRTTLTYGTDYTLNWYNGFGPDTEEGYDNSSAPLIRRYHTELTAPDKTYITDEIEVDSNASHRVTNTNTVIPGVEAAPLFAHGEGYEAVPESRIMRVTLLLSDLSGRSPSNTYDGEIGIFNVRPVNARASWDVHVSMAGDSAGTLMVWMASISDGYNRQYYNHYDQELTFNLLNFDEYATYTYSR